MAAPVLVENAQGQLRTYAGSVRALLSVGGYTPTASVAYVADVVAYEVDTADAPGYARPSFTAAYTRVGDDGVFDFASGQSATVDADGATDLIGWWIYKHVTNDADSPLICFVPLATGGAGTASFSLLAPNGFARDRLKTVDAAATALSGLTDVDTTTTPPADLDSLMFNNTSGKWEPGVPAGTGGTFAVVDAVIAADAVDGTGDQFTFIGYDRGGAGGGIVPASWVGVEGFIDVDAATLAGGITALYGGSATFLVYTGSVWSVRTVTDATVTDPWPAVTAYNVVGSVAGILDSGVFHAADADSIAATGSGLDAGFFKVGEILRNHEGTLDRWFFMSAVGTTDKDVSDLGSEAWEYGALNFTDGSGDPTTHCHVWLKNQTDPDETGFYSVAAGTFVATKYVHPDVFDPPGMGYRATLLYPGDASNGTTWIWMADDPAIHFRANRVDDPGLVGDWVLWIDPAGGGGSVATDAIWDAAGDLAYGTGSNTATRLPLGTTGHVLKAGASAPAWGTLAKADVGLGNVTNDAQVPLATVPTTVPAASWQSATGFGTPLAGYITTPVGVAFSTGVCMGFRTEYRTTTTTLVIESTASSLTAGQGVIIYCYAISASTGLPTGTPLWSETVTIGTSVAVFDQAAAHTIEPNQFIVILNPSTNAGSVTLRSAQPTNGGFGATPSTANRNALQASSQGASMGDVSAYVNSSGAAAARWTAALNAPVVLAR